MRRYSKVLNIIYYKDVIIVIRKGEEIQINIIEMSLMIVIKIKCSSNKDEDIIEEI